MDWPTHILTFLLLYTAVRLLHALELFLIEALASGARWLAGTNRTSAG